MTTRPLAATVTLILAHGLAAGCSGASSAPTAPTVLTTSTVQTTSATIPPAGSGYPTNPILMSVAIFGVVSEVTANGPQPIEGVEVYCDSCGEVGHTSVETDATGSYRFNGDLASGGGVWVQRGFTNYLIVTKDGYQDPAGLPAPTWPSTIAGWREVTVDGDTRFNIELIRR